MNADTYILDFEMARLVSGDRIHETLLTLIIKAIIVARETTGVTFAKMINPKEQAQRICDARHIAALLAYEETYRSGASKKVISEFFGNWHGEMITRAQHKVRVNTMFAKRMQAARARFEKIILAEYDKEIPF